MAPTTNVTILLSVFNGERHLRKALDSLCAQTMPEFELLIIDDGSTDATGAILASYQEPRLHVVRNASNLGLTVSLNRGLALAQGTYIARLDADDIA